MASSILEKPAHQLQAPLSLPLRNILIALSLTIVTLSAVALFWGHTGFEMLIVTMGWPHVLLGFAFQLGRVLRGDASVRTSFLFLGLGTAAIWIVHYNFAITGLIYLFFLYHAFRDEVFVYLHTRARHKNPRSVFAISGLGPLILLLLLIPHQQDFRQDLRRVEFLSNDIFPSSNDWSLITFKPIPNSAGRDFYFYLQSPHTAGLKTFVTLASTMDKWSKGEVRVGDRIWPNASGLIFQPRYGNNVSTPQPPSHESTIPVLLSGGHKVGQTFTASADNLSGIWFPVSRLENPAPNLPFVFHITSPPMLPYSSALETLRIVLIIVVGLWLAIRLFPPSKQNSELWIYLVVLGAAFSMTQMILKSSANAGYTVPLIFQFVVIFHYWSWYVFSYDKFSALSTVTGSSLSANAGRYQQLLTRLRRPTFFTVVVLIMHFTAALGVVWYYQLSGPSVLRYAFDYNNFLYVLVFHVTFSFSPSIKVPQRWRAIAT